MSSARLRRRPAPQAGAQHGARVVVSSKQLLLRDAVRTALRRMGFATTSLAVPAGAAQFHDARRWIARVRPTAGLLVAELDDAQQLREAVAVITGLDISWVLLTGTPQGPVWGAVIDAGAHDVLPTTASLVELSAVLNRVSEGSPDRECSDFDDVVRAWHDTSQERRKVTRRIETLSPREMEILVELHDGDSVKVIAARAGVSEGTVRTQVKSVLHKLEVTSQLQAVAAYQHANEWFSP
jgi:DNA-binding NarL/FixJ family response regulator